MRDFDLFLLYHSTIGFGRLFNHLENNQNQSDGDYPPYNVELADENHYRIAITVVSFAESELEITAQDNLLMMKGAHADEQKERTCLHQDIAGRNFERKFQLAENTCVRGANLVNGLPYIGLERVIPEAERPRRTEINQFPKAAWRDLTSPCSPSGSICGSSGLQVITHFLEGEMTMHNFDLSPLTRQWIGFDKLANVLRDAGGSQDLPPRNTGRSGDNRYRIALALTGFRREDLETQLEDTRLSVKGMPKQPEEEKKWLHQGFMNQPFSLGFTLAEDMEASGATFVNDLLYISLVHNEPEPIAAQRITISEYPALSS